MSRLVSTNASDAEAKNARRRTRGATHWAASGILTHSRSGQSLVEFALALPIFLLLALGVIEFGRLLFIYTAVTTSSREAARYGAAIGVTANGVVRYNDCDGMRAAARRIGSLAGIEDANILITYDHGPGTDWGDPPADCQGSYPPGEAGLGDRVVVNVTATYRFIVPLVRLPSFDITSTTARTIVKDVYPFAEEP